MTAWPQIFLLQDATRREALTRHFHGAATDIRADRGCPPREPATASSYPSADRQQFCDLVRVTERVRAGTVEV